MESKGFIRKSKSQFGAPVFYVPKKDGSRRLCVDYRGLNAIIVKDRYPIPLTKQLLESLSQSTIFTKIDLRSAYHLVRIQPGDEHKTAFRCRYGHYEYLVMPFGLANAPSIFMRLIQQALSEYLDIFAVVYLDDILVYSRNVTDHVPHVRLVLASLRKFQLYAKLEKCDFHQESIEFLGYIISKDGFRMAPSKVKSIAEWPTPMSVKQVQSFLGLANFYRIFIKNFSKICRPLTELTKKDHNFQWGSEEKDAFAVLKSAIMSEPVLAHPDYTQPFMVETYASDYALGAILCQQRDSKKSHPIAFYSHKLLPAERNYSVYDRNCLQSCMLSVNGDITYWQRNFL